MVLDRALTKTEFVDELSNFYINCVGNPIGIESLTYFADKYDEWIYVQYPSGVQKRVIITGDSLNGIFKDFVSFTQYRDEYKWIREGDKDYL